jgi:hypothetical protein
MLKIAASVAAFREDHRKRKPHEAVFIACVRTNTYAWAAAKSSLVLILTSYPLLCINLEIEVL